MTFRDLLSHSDPARIGRADNVNSKSLGIQSNDEEERWTFSYKSQGHHSTTGQRHRGYIGFFKENVSGATNMEDVDCIAECSCPDFKYKYAYNNNKVGVTPIGSTALNTNNGQKPQPQNDLGVGLCKHLISLGEYLKTGIDAPEEPKNPATNVLTKSPSTVPPIKPEPAQTTSDAPTPEDDHVVSNDELPKLDTLRPKYKTPPIKPKPIVKKIPNTYSDTDRIPNEEEPEELTEINQSNNLYNKFESFIETHPQFEVKYND